MCGIGGILSKKNENVVPLVGSMLSCMINRGPDGAGIAADEHSIQSDSFSNLRYQKLSGSSALGHVRLAIVGGTCGQQPFRSCDGRLTVEHNGEIYNYKTIRKRLMKYHKFTTQTDSEVIVHLIEDYFMKKNDLLYAIKRTVAELDGVYAFVVKEEESGILALVRDKMGVRQIYYGENDRFIAFASERKALWKIGIKEPTKRVLPCYAVIISPDGSLQEFKIANLPIQSTKKVYKTMASAVNIYEKKLLASMKKRTQDFDKVGIIFSGGIDSVIIAWLAKKMVPEVICYTGGISGSNDILYARQIAKKLDLKLRVNELSQDEVEQMIPEVINTIEDTNAGQIEVAIPVYAAVKLAHEDGINVMFSGQAADELFGGYSWYTNVVEKEGYQKLREHMTEGMLDIFSAIARKHGFDESTISKQYLNVLQSREKIGSSQRYGYLFENEKMWIAEPHVQMYLDSISKTLPTLEENLVANRRKDKKGY